MGLSAYAVDNGLAAIHQLADAIWLCTEDPATYADATVNYALGYSKWPGPGSVFDPVQPGVPMGRQVTSMAIIDGVVTKSGIASYWAVCDTANARLLATGLLGHAVPMVAGQRFQLGPFSIQQSNQL